MNTQERYTIHPGVFYRCYDDKTIVYHTGRQTVLTLNESAGFILNSLGETYSTINDIVDTLAHNYSIEDKQVFSKEIKCFVEGLLEREIIQKEFCQEENLDDLESEVSRYFSSKKQLNSVTIEVTYKCNEKCKHCYVDNKGKTELSLVEIKKILDELAELDAFSLVFTGGEFFLRDDAFEILEYAYAKHFVFEIFTNGTLIAGNDYIRLKRVWPKCIHFSLYSHIPEKHDAITRVNGSYKKTLDSIKACSTIGIPVNIKCPVFAETINDVEEIIKLANSLRVSIELGDNITPRINGDTSPTDLAVDDERGQYLLEVKKRWFMLSEAEETDSTSEKLCGAGDKSISINPYGDVFPCSMLQISLGSIREQSIKSIWEHSETLGWWRKNNNRYLRIGCEECDLQDKCIYCPGEALIRTGNPLCKYEKACSDSKKAIQRKVSINYEC